MELPPSCRELLNFCGQRARGAPHEDANCDPHASPPAPAGMLLADAEGQMELPDEARDGARRQLERLRTVRGPSARAIEAARDFFVHDKPAAAEEKNTYDPSLAPLKDPNDLGSLDRQIAKAGMLASAEQDTGGAMDEMD